MSEDSIHLHILNGDYAFELWKECGFSGEGLVWRETYLEGPLPETEDLHLFRTARTDFLSQFPEIKHIDKSMLYKYLQKMDDSVLQLPGSAVLMLWFDACIFDQTILMRILYLLSLRQNDAPDVFLYCCDDHCLTAADFRRGIGNKIHLPSSDLTLGAEAWRLFQKKDAAGMIRLSEKEDFSRLSKMQKALLRCAEDVPDRITGLNRTQRQILQLVSGGCRSFSEIFRGLDSFEDFPFLGDTACRRHLDLLVRSGHLVCGGEGYTLP